MKSKPTIPVLNSFLLWRKFGTGPPSVQVRVPSQWVQFFSTVVRKPRIAGMGGGGGAALSVVGNSNAWKENWERRQKAEKNLGAEGKAVP